MYIAKIIMKNAPAVKIPESIASLTEYWSCDDHAIRITNNTVLKKLNMNNNL